MPNDPNSLWTLILSRESVPVPIRELEREWEFPFPFISIPIQIPLSTFKGTVLYFVFFIFLMSEK